MVIAGCTGEPEPAATHVLDGGWPQLVAQEPDRFASLLEHSSREGWIALHGGDLLGAQGAFEGHPLAQARALWALSALHADLASLSELAFERTYHTWAERSGLPEGSAIPVLAALSALDADEPARARSWLARGSSYTDADVSALAQSLGSEPTSLSISEEASLAGPGACVQAHLRARSMGDATALSPCSGPLVSEASDTHSRELHDPLIHATLTQVYALQAGRILEDPVNALSGRLDVSSSHGALEVLLFSPWWAPLDARSDNAPTTGTAGIGSPTIHELRLPAMEQDDIQAARSRVRKLDAELDTWLSTQQQATTGEGLALLNDLQLVPVYRSRVLLAWAREALEQGHPRAALATAQLALDVENSRAVSPRNPPGLFAVLAWSQLATGHTREALDALQPLIAPFPEVLGLNETIGDLAIIEGLSRMGDSKEH
jgi:hypothetical protein